jgi:hypothetical protein
MDLQKIKYRSLCIPIVYQIKHFPVHKFLEARGEEGLDPLPLYVSMKKQLLKIGAWFFGVVIGICLCISSGLYFFKDEICGAIVDEINTNLKAKVSVSKVDLAFWGSFPNLSVDFKDVFIQDSYTKSTKKDTLLFTDRIRLKFNPLDIWNEKYDVKEIDINPGTLQLKINGKGEPNYDIVKTTSSTKKSNFKLKMKNVSFSSLRFSFQNKLSEQSYATFIKDLSLNGDFSDTEFTLNSTSHLLLHHARSGKIDLLSKIPIHFSIKIFVDKLKNTFEIPKATLFVANLPFDLKGKVTSTDLNFRIRSKNISLADAVNHIAHSSLQEVRKYRGKGIVQFDARIVGKTEATEAPETTCSFAIKDGSLTEPSIGLRIKNVQLEGHYSNKGGIEKEFLNLRNFSFQTAGGPFSGNLRINRFSAPIYKGKAKGHIDLSIAHRLLKVPGIEQLNGHARVNAQYHIESNENQRVDGGHTLHQCDGEISLKNVSLKRNEDKRRFHAVNGQIYLRGDELGMEDVSLKVDQSDIQMKGVFQNIVSFFQNNGKLDALVEVSSSYLDIQDLATETKSEEIRDGKHWIMPVNLSGTVTLNAQEIKYEKHLFKRFKGTLQIAEHALHFSDVTVNNAKADIRGSVSIEEKSQEIFTITTQIASDNIEFKPLFKEWNNFEQDIISENNIDGKVHVTLDFTAPFDLKNGVRKQQIRSIIHLKIMEGRLKEVPTFKAITESLKTSSAKYVLGKTNLHDFENKLRDLTFETLENTLIIRNGQLEIPSMMILSSALDMELVGTHGFDDKIDYRFAFRYREVKTQKKQDEFGTIIDDGTGIKIYIRMSGTSDNPTIEWDKEAKKEQAKENREAAKQDVKSILKTEFGLFQNDTSVKTYQQSKKAKEELKIEFGPAKKEEAIPDLTKVKKDSKIGNTLKKWKEEAEKAKKEEIRIGD